MYVCMHFQAKCATYSNFHIIETTAWIKTKFCTPIQTTKYTSWVVQNTENKSKSKNRDILATVLPILTKFGTVMHLRP